MKTLNVSDKYGNKYTLEYTRDTVRVMEKQGFSLEEIDDKSVLTITLLFQGAFLAHHRNTKPEIVDEMFEMMPNKEALLKKLIEMYNEPLDTMMEEPKESGNVMWEANW